MRIKRTLLLVTLRPGAPKAAKYGKEAADLQVKLAKAEQAEQQAAERARQREQKEAERRATAERKKIQGRLATTEERVGIVLRQLREPKPEKLRVLMLGAASEGDLRVSREQARIRTAVERALHRDLVELDVHPRRYDRPSTRRPHQVPPPRGALLRPQ
jgi:flagellar biosynthesis GTPase FlhF